jgi:hypothetical protein
MIVTGASAIWPRSISFWNRILMASERQRQANRRNGRKGGPKTETGKQASRRNSLKHGLTSSTLLVLPEENQHEYEAIHYGFRESFQPLDAAEEALVLRLAQAHWRSLRSRRVETGILNITAATERSRATEIVDDCPKHLSPHNAIAVGFMTGPAERWQAYLRYDTTISRDFFRTLDALTRLQRARQVRKSAPLPGFAAAAGAGPVVPPSPNDIAAGQLCAELSDSGIRSVSQNDGVPANCNEPKELAHATKPQTSSEPPNALRARQGNHYWLRQKPQRSNRADSVNSRTACKSTEYSRGALSTACKPSNYLKSANNSLLFLKTTKGIVETLTRNGGTFRE